MIGAERPRCLILREFNVAGRLQQAIQPSRCGRVFGQEQVHAVKRSHVPDPVRLEDRLAPRHRQRMECPDGTQRLLLKIVEVWRCIPVQDSVQNAEMEFQRLFHLVEHASDAARGGIPRCLFHVAVSQKIQV